MRICQNVSADGFLKVFICVLFRSRGARRHCGSLVPLWWHPPRRLVFQERREDESLGGVSVLRHAVSAAPVPRSPSPTHYPLVLLLIAQQEPGPPLWAWGLPGSGCGRAGSGRAGPEEFSSEVCPWALPRGFPLKRETGLFLIHLCHLKKFGCLWNVHVIIMSFLFSYITQFHSGFMGPSWINDL